ncbi:nonstructural protein [Microviridae sp.]|nr:nonstructural protein [Microviridae sp.]
MKMYTIYDSKAEAYMKPFYARTRGEAIRSCEQAANDPESQFFSYAEDYVLFEIGEFSELTGELTTKTGEAVIKMNELQKMAYDGQPTLAEVN